MHLTMLGAVQPKRCLFQKSNAIQEKQYDDIHSDSDSSEEGRIDELYFPIEHNYYFIAYNFYYVRFSREHSWRYKRYAKYPTLLEWFADDDHSFHSPDNAITKSLWAAVQQSTLSYSGNLHESPHESEKIEKHSCRLAPPPTPI
jgi:hypothetical protein